MQTKQAKGKQPSRRSRPLALSIDEAAAALSISRDSFERYVAPEIRLLAVGRRLVVPVVEIERWIEIRAEIPASEAVAHRCAQG